MLKKKKSKKCAHTQQLFIFILIKNAEKKMFLRHGIVVKTMPQLFIENI